MYSLMVSMPVDLHRSPYTLSSISNVRSILFDLEFESYDSDRQDYDDRVVSCAPPLTLSPGSQHGFQKDVLPSLQTRVDSVVKISMVRHEFGIQYLRRQYSRRIC